MKTCTVIEAGRIGYSAALELQQQLVAARKRGDAPDVLLLCEHPHVLTLGRNGKIDNLRVSRDELSQLGVEFHHTTRGGDITYHGPGQIVGYPILNLGEIRRDVGWYVRQLEQCMIAASAAFGVAAFRIPGCTGVWALPAAAPGSDRTDGDRTGDKAARWDAGGTCWPPLLTAQKPRLPEQKLGAIGVRLSRWVTSHGFAYNVTTDLRYFGLIVPCGISERGTTSLEALLGRQVTRAEVAPHIVEGFGEALGLRMIEGTGAELAGWIGGASEAAGQDADRVAGGEANPAMPVEDSNR